MESQLSHPHNKPKACYKSESRSKTQHQETTVPPGMRGVQNKKEVKSIDSLMQTKSPTGTLTPSTPTTSAPTSPTALPATSTSFLVPGATPSSTISPMTPMTKIMDEHAFGITQGTTLTRGTSEHKIKYSGEGEQRTTEKTSSKNIQKPTPPISIDLQKSFQKTPPTKTGLSKSVQQTTFSQISMSSRKLRSSPIPASDDRAETIHKGRTKDMAPSPKFKSNDSRAFVMEDGQEVHSVQPLGTKQRKIEKLKTNKDAEKNRHRAEEEGTSKDVQEGCSLNGKETTPQVLSKSPIFPLDRLQSLSGSLTASASQEKETAGKTEENATGQEKMCERGKRREWMDGMERREALEHRNGQKVKDQEKTDEEEMEKEIKRQDKNIEANEQKDIEMEDSNQKKKFNHIFKRFKDVTTMTNTNPIPVQTFDAALQTEVVYKDAEVQAVVDVRDKSTTTSPNMTRSSWSQLGNKANLNNFEKVSGTTSLNLQNGLSQDVSVNSGLAPVEFMDQSLRPTSYNSSISSKPTRQHVCQIEIELCSQSTMSDSLALPEEEGSQLSSTRPGLEREPKQVNKDQAQAEKGLLQEVAWDDQGMTWEIYGAAVDMESLGFAIQNHLQRKITEHEQHFRHLRKSVSLSEHLNGEGKEARKKKKRKVFRSLRPTCCLKSESEASVAY